MDQQIRFCTTSDGVCIAYSAVGQGPPLVKAANWLTHLEFDWESPVWRHLFSALAENHTLVRYDERGTGLSDRQVDEISLEGLVRDLEAVVDTLGLERFALLGISQGGPTAMQYAVTHPERVSHLVLYGSFAHVGADERGAALASAMRVGWGQDNPAFRQLFTTLFIPGANGEQMAWFNELERVSASPETAARVLESIGQIDVRNILPDLQAPTIVIHPKKDAAVFFERGREMAALIPGARFVPMEGSNHYILEQEPEFETFLDLLEGFLGHKAVRLRANRGAPVTVMFTDLVGHTEMMQRLGDERGREVLREHERMTRDALKQYGGTEIKTDGDSFMVSFGSVTAGVDCAIALQRAFAARNEGGGEALHVRIGLNAGEPVEEEGDLFGSSVILAARVAAKASAGEILIPEPLRHLLSGKTYVHADRGETLLKGFEDAVRLYEVRWQS
ncbi:MAG: adenylate/guanylate cyclase domain-containing protein [Dehalococcoidia bacterium]